MAAILQKLKERYALDVRALSLMRVVIALVLLADLCIRATSLNAHYTSAGVVPYPEVELAFWRNSYFSFFTLNGSFWFAAILFIVTGFIYFCLLIGYRTRIFSVLAWVMLVSLQNCNSAILQCGDDELRLILFWGIFLPWGNFYSIDAKRYHSLQRDTKYFDVPGIAYVLLIFSVYFFTGILKDSIEWDDREGSAFYYALNLDQMTWPLGKMLLPHISLLKALTITAKWIEICGPFLLLIPFRNTWFRMLFFFVFTAFHIAISLTLFVGLFYIISIAVLLGLLSPKTMDKFEFILKIKRPALNENEVPFPGEIIAKNYYFKVIKNCFVFFCIALGFIWNLSNIEGPGLRVSEKVFGFGFFLRLDQHWNMFAPNVIKDDGWFVMEGITPDKKNIDINRDGAPVDFSKPGSVLKYIKDDRWRKYYENYVIIDNLFMRPFLCNYLLKDWNKNHPEAKIDTLNVIFMRETTPPPGNPLPVPVKENLCKCGK
ncbi:MAG TPA: HTTM domain-containing protein [Bacteroidia bacterium]|jgi:hypothetical protein|nr:HTTM domain-containing protein [Bacteroidia bacterium]